MGKDAAMKIVNEEDNIDFDQINRELFTFLDHSPNTFFAVRNMCDILRQAGVPYQTFANRSDMLGGSTLGNISQSQVALNTVDIGLPQLAMHSPYETAGAKDTAYLAKAAGVLFSSCVEGTGDGNYKLRF